MNLPGQAGELTGCRVPFGNDHYEGPRRQRRHTRPQLDDRGLVTREGDGLTRVSRERCGGSCGGRHK